MTYLGGSFLPSRRMSWKKSGWWRRTMWTWKPVKPAVGRLAAEKNRAQHACITPSCCAAGLQSPVASVLTDREETFCKMEALPKVDWFPKKWLSKKAHGQFRRQHFPGNFRPVRDIEEIGTVNVTKRRHLLSALKKCSSGCFCGFLTMQVFNGMLSLQKTIEPCPWGSGSPRHRGCGGGDRPEKYAQSGADLVVFSGHKAIRLVDVRHYCWEKNRRIAACQMQDKGIARMMKVKHGKYYYKRNFALGSTVRFRQKCRKKLPEAKRAVESSFTRASGSRNANRMGWDRPVPRTLFAAYRKKQNTTQKAIDRFIGIGKSAASIRTREPLGG